MSPPSSTIILFFRLQATNVVWNKIYSIICQNTWGVFCCSNRFMGLLYLLRWPNNWCDHQLLLSSSEIWSSYLGLCLCPQTFNYALVFSRLWITKLCVHHCGGGQGEKYARVAYPEQKLKYNSDTWKEGREKKRESDWNDKWNQDQSECKIYFIMLTVSPSSLSGSLPPFEN